MGLLSGQGTGRPRYRIETRESRSLSRGPEVSTRPTGTGPANCGLRRPLGLSGDPRRTRPPRSRPRWPTASRPANSTRRCPTRWSSSGPRTPSTATTPPTSRCAWPRRPAARPARSPRRSPPGCAPRPASSASTSPGPGFLNITLAAAALGELARVIVEAGAAVRPHRHAGRAAAQPRVRLGQSDRPGAHRRRAVGRRRRCAGPAACRPAARDVTREYYFNDAGSQIERFARTLREVANGRPVPEDGYAGDYIDEIAAAVVAAHPERAQPAAGRADRGVPRDGVELMFDEIRTSLADFGVVFDVYFNERDLHDRGTSSTTRSSGCASRATSTRPTARSGCAPPTTATTGTACWCAATASGPTSPPTAPTTSTSGERGFDKVVIMLGADHHGYIKRLRAMADLLRRRPGPDAGDPASGSWSTWSRTASRCG